MRVLLDKFEDTLLEYFEGLTTPGLYKLLGITLVVATVLFLL